MFDHRRVPVLKCINTVCPRVRLGESIEEVCNGHVLSELPVHTQVWIVRCEEGEKSVSVELVELN